jgi:hypothetical protein
MSSLANTQRNFAFVGPTYERVKDRTLIPRAGFEVMPPVRRGDIRALLNYEPGVIVIIDGRFHQSLAVGHAELRLAIEAGWVLWGLSSMGAIRAFEMRTMGMRGFGEVYQHFLAEGDFQDDEVALLHAADPPFVALSEPLIHIRHFLAELETSQGIDRQVAQQIVDDLKAKWFGERNLPALVSLISRYCGPDVANVARSYIREFDRFRVKTRDLVAFFEGAYWRADPPPPRPTPAPYTVRPGPVFPTDDNTMRPAPGVGP